MPKTTSRPASPGEQPTPEMQFVKCDLSEAQKKDLALFSEALKPEALVAWIERTVLANHVVSVRANDTGFQCSVTGAKGNEAHTNKCLVARASTVTRSIHSAMFKDATILKGDWSKVQTRDELDF
jgi:hypothetical protein